jgi:hypothetical protein
MGWATFWSIVTQTHLVTMVSRHLEIDRTFEGFEPLHRNRKPKMVHRFFRVDHQATIGKI